ncbi:MAG: SDR family NAD(P)-dependent oxidoreductase [Dehalococcoidia bacterium]|nr:SDR family NAD(P)-dependent oxidoreductase [Dehalococcoidia bacterium]
MKDFKGKVAVVTGAASGIGRGMAERFAREGMKVVLADVEEAALAQAETAMRAAGATVLAVRTDVSQAAEVEALARRAVQEFGAVDIVCNNAGVVPRGGPLWETPLQDWQWTIGVNLWGVIHGVHTFVPLMLRQGTEAHVVNTASLAGLITGPFLGIYAVTKHAVVALSESLYQELALAGSKVHVSVLCPAWVNTRLMDAGRNRPPNYRTEDGGEPGQDPITQAVRGLLATGLSPETIAEHVVNAIREEKLYILTHPEFKDGIKARMDNILAGTNPVAQSIF